MKKLLNQIVFYLCLGAGTLVMFVIFLDNLAMPFLVDVDKVKVPDLISQPFEAAQRRLAEKDLRLVLRDSSYHEAISVGRIVEQTPTAGYPLKKGRQVSVDISRGVRLYTVPDLSGRSLREAQLRLDGIQLKIGGIVYTSSESIPEGVIVGQHPPPSTQVLKGHQVDLTISNGSPLLPKRVPHLLGLSIEAVEDTLHKYEMALGRIEQRLDQTLSLGTVLEQSIPSSDRAIRGTSIDLVISVLADSLPQENP
jgi:beta-lactam-binding protein with PASTA domain